MNILCAGVNHHLAPVEVREKFAVGDHELPSVLENLRRIDGTAGAVVLSTCNRVEFYAATICPVRTLQALRSWLTGRAPQPLPLYEMHTPASVRHLFRVSCGLDSMVLGETEVLGQVKKAYSLAAASGAPSRHLHRLFQHAFRVAKHVRTHTAITRGATSVSAVAVELAGKIFGSLEGRNVMVLGAGETGERTIRSLQSRGARGIIVANRTFARAATLAEEVGGMAVHFDHWQDAFQGVDILIGSTGAPHPIINRERLAPLMARRADRPLFVIDLAVPRDIAPDVNDLDGVFLYDMDALQEIARATIDTRQQEVLLCEKFIDTEVGSFIHWLERSRVHSGTASSLSA